MRHVDGEVPHVAPAVRVHIPALLVDDRDRRRPATFQQFQNLDQRHRSADPGAAVAERPHRQVADPDPLQQRRLPTRLDVVQDEPEDSLQVVDAEDDVLRAKLHDGEAVNVPHDEDAHAVQQRVLGKREEQLRPGQRGVAALQFVPLSNGILAQLQGELVGRLPKLGRVVEVQQDGVLHVNRQS